MQKRQFVPTGILGLDDILGHRLQGERILLIGPPGSGKSTMALALMYKAILSDGPQTNRGVFLTTDVPASDVRDFASGLFMSRLNELLDQSIGGLDIVDFPPYAPPFDSVQPSNERDFVDDMLRRLREETREAPQYSGRPVPRHIVIDSLTAMQSVLNSGAEVRRLTHMLIGYLSFPRGSSDLIVMTAEAGPTESVDTFLFDTVIYLDIIKTPADRRLRTIEILKSRGRHGRTGQHTFSIVSSSGLPQLIRSEAARDEIRAYDIPIVIYPSEPRTERPLDTPTEIPLAQYLPSGIDGLDELLDRTDHRGVLQNSTTILVGETGTGSSILALRYLIKGLQATDNNPVLLVSFGRDLEDFTKLGNNFPWLGSVLRARPDDLHFLYYRPINLDQNRLFYEIRKEIIAYKIDRVVIDSISSLTFVDINSDVASDFLVTFIGMLKELHCTPLRTYVTDKPLEPAGGPGEFFKTLADNIIELKHSYDEGQNKTLKLISIVKARGTDARIGEKREYIIEQELSVRTL